MIAFLQWYLLITLIGLVAWPLAWRMLPGLPDRGYTVSRAVGLLIGAYSFWLLASLGFLRNTTGAMLLGLLILAGLSIWAAATAEESPVEWLRGNLRFVLSAEALFLVAFAAWAVIRAGNPDLTGTEKPMELAFLNGIRMSSIFPPLDPWLAGYPISYYYFGYVMVAMLADLTSMASGVAFNLAVALLFAMTCLGAYGIAYNLLMSRPVGWIKASTARVGALLAPLFVAVIGNLAGFFDMLRGLGALPAAFWAWLDIQEMSQPITSTVFPPHEIRPGWWWRSSRVIHDVTPAGASSGLQPIDEFPYFSFLLADMHPHVLALPFVLAALVLAFNAMNQRERLSTPQMGFYTIVVGGLAFLNAWDLPIYLFVVVAALIVRNVKERGGVDLAGVLFPTGTGLIIAVGALLAYFPWIISFTSQAGGILPNALFPTRFQQFFVMFGVFLPVVVWFLVVTARRKEARPDFALGAQLAGALLLLLITLMVGLSAAAYSIDEGARRFALDALGIADGGLGQVLGAILSYRLLNPITALALAALIAAATAVLLPLPFSPDAGRKTPPTLHNATLFAVVLILTGALLTLGPEFIYLRDNFGQRLNTVFKFYYAAWVLFGVAAAYGAVVLLNEAEQPPAPRTAFAVTLIVLIGAGLVYTVYAPPSRGVDLVRTGGEPPLTLDGTAYLSRSRPAEYEALQWLEENASADTIVLEAVGGAYSTHARVSALTGVPTVMGWANHQRQWRGPLYGELAGSRESDVREIYDTPNIRRALDLLEQYNVDYIYVGHLETDPNFASPAGIAKFERFFTPVYQNGGVTIYRVDELATGEATP